MVIDYKKIAEAERRDREDARLRRFREIEEQKPDVPTAFLELALIVGGMMAGAFLTLLIHG